jgi:tetratricopeptide (TPR) repeat protein
MLPIHVRALLAFLIVAGLASPRRADGRDMRIQAAEKTLLATYDAAPHDIIVEAVLDPAISYGDRYDLLRTYLEAQRAIKGDRGWMREVFLPRLEKMYKELPAQDVRGLVQVLRGISYIYRDRDSSDIRMIQFLQQQLRSAGLSPARREACKAVLQQLQGEEAPATGVAWLDDEHRLLELSKNRQFAEMYERAWSIVADADRPVADRICALRHVNELLARPTGIPYERTLQDLESLCLTTRNADLAEALARSAMRAAFLEALQPADSRAVLERLQSSSAPVPSRVAQTLLARIEAQRQSWVFDAAGHQEAADRIVQAANLDPAGRAEYRKLIARPDYRDHPVGAAPRWWMLGEFLWNHRAVPASLEAFRNYVRTRCPSSEPDARLRDAVHLMRLASESLGPDPVEFWADACTLARGQGASAFVTAMIEELQGPTRDTTAIAAVGKRVLERGPQAHTAEAVIRLIPLSTDDLNALAERAPHAAQADQARLALAIALTREGRYQEATKYLSTSTEEPLPGVPLFRVVGLADCLFAAGDRRHAEALIRSLLRRNVSATQSVNLLAYLMTRYLDADLFEDATRIQQELFRGYGAAEPEAISSALAKCLDAIQAKGNVRAELLTTRLLCQVVNGELYEMGDDGTPPQKSLRFWQDVLEWSRDHKQTSRLAGLAEQADGRGQADLVRVLLARTSLDEGDLARAAEYLAMVGRNSTCSALAAKEQARLDACRERDAELASVVIAESKVLADMARQREAWSVAVESYLLLAEFASDPASQAEALSDATQCCKAGDLIDAYGSQIERRLSALNANQTRQAASAETLRTLRMRREQSPAATRSASTAPVACLDEPLASAYAATMLNVGLAFRGAGRFERAAACFHKAFQYAPFSAAAPRSLQEEAQTLRLYMGQPQRADDVHRLTVAVYPLTSQGQMARTRLRVHYEGTMGKHPE